MKAITRRALLRGGIGAGGAGAIGLITGGMAGVLGTFLDVSPAGATIKTVQRTTNTCPCTLEYQWDDTVLPDLRIFTLTRIINRGEEHAGILDAALFTITTEEAQRWSKAMLEVDANSLGTARTWLYTPGRLLQIMLPAISAARKRAIQDAIDLEVGPGKVEII